MLERRFCAAQHGLFLEKRADGGQMIVGYAAVYYQEGDPGSEYELFPAGLGMPRMVERIKRTAFLRALKEQQNVRALFNHDPNKVLGTVEAGTLRLKSDLRGLRYEIDDPSALSYGRDLLVSLGRGDITGSSFGFQMVEGGHRFATAEDGSEIRELTDVDVLDVSPVTYPAYTATSAGLRAIGDVQAELRTARQAWLEREQLGQPPATKGTPSAILARRRAVDIMELE